MISDFTDPADDPSSPDYRLTAEHYPRYLLPPKQPIIPKKEESFAKIEELPQAQPLQHNKEEVIIRSNDFGDIKFIRESNGCTKYICIPIGIGIGIYLSYISTCSTISLSIFSAVAVIVAGCSTVAAFLIVSTGYCVYRVHQNQRMTQDVDYPAYGVTGPVKNAMGSPPADRKLAQSAQMYHFQHQKQQMIAVEK